MGTLRSLQPGWCAVAALLLACSSSPTESTDDPPPGDLVIAPQAAEVSSGGIRQFRVTVRSQNGRLIVVQGVSWVSSDATVAQINQQGTLRAGQVGTAQVIARWNGSQAAATVTVVPRTPGCADLQSSALSAGSAGIPCKPRIPEPGKRRPSEL